MCCQASSFGRGPCPVSGRVNGGTIDTGRPHCFQSPVTRLKRKEQRYGFRQSGAIAQRSHPDSLPTVRTVTPVSIRHHPPANSESRSTREMGALSMYPEGRNGGTSTPGATLQRRSYFQSPVTRLKQKEQRTGFTAIRMRPLNDARRGSLPTVLLPPA